MGESRSMMGRAVSMALMFGAGLLQGGHGGNVISPIYGGVGSTGSKHRKKLKSSVRGSCRKNKGFIRDHMNSGRKKGYNKFKKYG